MLEEQTNHHSSNIITIIKLDKDKEHHKVYLNKLKHLDKNHHNKLLKFRKFLVQARKVTTLKVELQQ